ncbi:hypothetical protein WJX84_001425 [Apatococcus fuscideae]|uniref:Uncharacterized protein n=1 Tax=Apatococcus fuscideae TaxID=2026836 RepID=A0AAW1T4P4_9CHLO
MPRVLPRQERDDFADEGGTAPLLGLCSQINSHVKELEELAQSIDGQEASASLHEVNLSNVGTRESKRKRIAGSSFSKFDLTEVKRALDDFVVGQDERLELEPFSRTRRKQVAALASIYNLEARACGRAGQTFFRTPETQPLDAEGDVQAGRLLLCSFKPPRSKKPRAIGMEHTKQAKGLEHPRPESLSH